jgi:hypothetical protein
LQIVILIIGFILGFGIGLFIYAQILLPLIYSLPKSIYLFFKGKLKFTAVIFWLVPPLIWLIILIGLGVVFEAVMPSVNRFLTGNAGFHLGQLLAIAALLIKFLSHKGRADIAEEYDRNTDARFRKDNQSIGAISTINLQDSQARHKSISQVRSEPPAPDQPDLSQRVDRIFLATFLDSLQRREAQSHQEIIMKLAKEKGAKEPDRLLELAKKMISTSSPMRPKASNLGAHPESAKECGELDLIRLYAKAWNTLNAEVIEPYLSEDVIYESQDVLSSLNGKIKVLSHLRGKMQTIRENLLQSDVFAELGYCGSQAGFNVQVWAADEGRPCVLMAQGNPKEVLALVLLETDEGMIDRIDICTVAPRPSSATRTGEYPAY